MLEGLLEPWRYLFMQRALLAALLVAIVCGTLGCFVVLRRMALIGDALSHAVLPGAAVAFLLGTRQFFWGAAVAGVLTALLIGWVTSHSRLKEDAAIGVVFTAAFALGIVLISAIQSRSVDLMHMLVGNVLGVENRDLGLTAGVAALVLLVVSLLYKEWVLHAFDPEYAAAIGLPVRRLHYLQMLLLSLGVVASLQTVGLVLVVAMLVTPASTAFLLVHRFARMWAVSVAVAALAAVGGLYLSYYANVSSGGTMVLVATGLFFLAFLGAPRRGLLARLWLRRQRQRQRWEEDALKHALRLEEEGARVDPDAVGARLGADRHRARRLWRRLERAGWVDAQGLTAGGRERAAQLVRAHRLWERYLVEREGMDEATVHEEAERLEHVRPETIGPALDEDLGHPARDPHGRPIPRGDAKERPV